MGFETINNEKIFNLIAEIKTVQNPAAKYIEKDGMKRKNYVLSGENGNEYTLYLRQNTRIGMYDDFSCGLSWLMSSGEVLTLVRYNGPSHQHRNHLEKEILPLGCHIHSAKEEYILAGRKPEGFAQLTDKYETLEGALHTLTNDCNIVGIKTQPDPPKQNTLFSL